LSETSASPFDQLRGTIGLWSFAHELLAPRDVPDFARRIEDLGFSSYWYPESFGREAFTSGSLLLGGTSSLIVATGIASIYARDANATAAAAKTLSALSSDRFILGLGVSHRPAVEAMRGHTYAAPVSTMDAYLDQMQAALNLSKESSTPLRTVLAALGPKMLNLAATKTNGALPYLVTPQHTEVAREALGPDAFLAVEQAVILSRDRDVITRRTREHLQTYTGLDNYTSNWRRLGFTDEDFIPGGSDALGAALVVSGDLDAIAERVAEHRAAGADHVCLQVLFDLNDGPPFEDFAALTPLNERTS
jgi:probable F420-dependent oxidoreductase